jgi:hypothetical protein
VLAFAIYGTVATAWIDSLLYLVMIVEMIFEILAVGSWSERITGLHKDRKEDQKLFTSQ